MAVFKKHGGLYFLSHSFGEPAIEERIKLSWEQINLNLVQIQFQLSLWRRELKNRKLEKVKHFSSAF